MNAPPPVADDFALFLDFDATLVEIAATASTVAPAPGLVHDLVDDLLRIEEFLGGALALVSGRPIRELDGLLAPLALAAAGLDGLETRWRRDAAPERAPVGPELGILKAALAGSGLLARGVTLEDKGGALAVHYRFAPDCEPAVLEVMRQAIGDLPDLDLVLGGMVAEARPAQRDKGFAVRQFMERAPFAGRTPVFVGDDPTDEDGIRAAQALGGFGVKVGEGDGAARFRLADVAAVHFWLVAALDASVLRRTR